MTPAPTFGLVCFWSSVLGERDMNQTFQDFQIVAHARVWDWLNRDVQRRIETGEAQREHVAHAVANGDIDKPEKLETAVGLALEDIGCQCQTD